MNEMMAEVSEGANFYIYLHTTLSRKQVADLYGRLGWKVRQCGWSEYEVIGPWAELVIEAESPILMHGSVADVLVRIEEMVAPLRLAGVAFIAECYGLAGELLQELKSDISSS